MISHDLINRLWYDKHPLAVLLVPFGWLFRFTVFMRRIAYQAGVIPVNQVAIPVIVVGNITIGGTGKTPLVIWLTKFLENIHYRPGVVCSGYQGAASHWPQQVRPDSDPHMAGDEAVLIAQRCQCPVAASPDRYKAVEGLLEHNDCNIIICDDGLQHYALARDIEIAVIDGDRRFGNGRCLPAGPLREPVSRLQQADMVVCNGTPEHGEYEMKVVPTKLLSLKNPEKQENISNFNGETIHAVAGIGNPDRFFQILKKQGVNVIEHQFPDHYRFQSSDIRFGDGLPVFMTEKDAVKCREFASDEHWYLSINVELSDTFQYRFSMLLKEISNGQETA